jgi:hypothetical protein
LGSAAAAARPIVDSVGRRVEQPLEYLTQVIQVDAGGRAIFGNVDLAMCAPPEMGSVHHIAKLLNQQ